MPGCGGGGGAPMIQQNKIAEPETFPNDVGPPEAHDHSKPRPERLWKCHGVISSLCFIAQAGVLTEARAGEIKPTYKNFKSGLFALPITNKQNFPTILV